MTILNPEKRDGGILMLTSMKITKLFANKI